MMKRGLIDEKGVLTELAGDASPSFYSERGGGRDMNETQLRELILKAISGGSGRYRRCTVRRSRPPPASGAVESGEVRDLSAVDFRQIIDVPTPANPEEFRRSAPKRWPASACGEPGPVPHPTPTCGSGRITRPPWTPCLPTCRASAGRDGPVHRADPLQRPGHVPYPGSGRRFSQETLAELRGAAKRNPDVRLVVSDGLSSTSVSANLRTSCPPSFKG